MEKECNSYSVLKPLQEFIKMRSNSTGYGAICKVCSNTRQREYRESNDQACSRKYEKTEKGYLMRTYRNMQSRVKGILKNKSHLYEGLPLLSKKEFYEWSLSPDVGFTRLLAKYKASNYDHKQAPSIDRIDSNLGYTLDNMRWMTHSENSKLGALSKHGKLESQIK